MAEAYETGAAGRDELVFLPLGGVGEIGMNCYLYGLGPTDDRQWLMVDLGITFPEGENDPGVDVICPTCASSRTRAGARHRSDHHMRTIRGCCRASPRSMCPLRDALHAASQSQAQRVWRRQWTFARFPSIARSRWARSASSSLGGHSIPDPTHSHPTRRGLVLHSGDWKIDPTPMIGIPADTPRFALLARKV